MPLFRKSLNWIAIAILAIFAPLVAIAIFAAEKVRTGRRARRAAVFWSGDTVVALAPRLRQRKEPARLPGNGAVILAFRRRSPVGMTTDDPQAATGSR